MSTRQTANFPPVTTAPDQSWSDSFEAWASLIAPGSGLRQGGLLGLPLAAGQPTAGLTPTLTDGYLLFGREVAGISSKMVSAAPANVANRKIFYGLKGLYYAGVSNAPETASDVLFGEITVNNASPTPQIVSVAQPLNFGNGRLGIRALLSLEYAAKGVDTTLFTWVRPSSHSNVRITHSYTRILAGVTAGNTTGDDLLTKFKVDSASAVTLTTISAANTASAGQISSYSTQTLHFSPTSIALQYNLTDTSTAIAGGLAELALYFDLF